MNNRTYLYTGVRTPIGKRNGKLADHPAVGLGALCVSTLLERTPATAAVDGVIIGQTIQAGSGTNPARVAAYRGGLDLDIPAMTLNNACLAGIDCMVDATRRINNGEGSAFLVGGMDSASGTPDLTLHNGLGHTASALYQDGLICAISHEHVGVISDKKNAELGIDRDEQDQWALMSHQRAMAMDFIAAGEAFPVETDDGMMTVDESIRPTTSLEALSKLRPVFTEGGTITAGNSSPVNDGAALGLVADKAFGERQNLPPLARIVGWGYSAGPDASLHQQPARATRAVLDKHQLCVADIDLFEINEAFAGVVIAAVDSLAIPHDIVNPNGGAIALGHPDAATAFRQTLTLALELRRRNAKRGIATLCGGGGQGIAILIENPDAN